MKYFKLAQTYIHINCNCELFQQNSSTIFTCTVIPAMVQRLFIAIITQRDHKYATPPPWKQFYVFFGNGSHRCFNRWHRLAALESKSMGKVLHVAHLWKNEGVAPLQKLLYMQKFFFPSVNKSQGHI